MGESLRFRFFNGFAIFVRCVRFPCGLRFPDDFGPCSGIFGTYSYIYGHIRTYSDIFGHIRTYSDIFEPYSDIFGPYSDIFGPYSDIFGHIRTIFGPYSDHIRTYSDHIRTIFGSYLGWAIHDALGDQTSHVECACTCMFCPDSRVFVLRLLPPWPPQTHP